MTNYLSPNDLMMMFGIGKSTAYKVFEKFEAQGGKVIRLGGKHAKEAELIEFLERSNETHT